MGRKEKKVKSAKEVLSSSDEEEVKVKSTIEEVNTDDDEEANEDLSLKIVQKAMSRACNGDPEKDGVSEIVTNLKDDKRQKEKREKKRKKKNKETEVPAEDVDPSELDAGFKNFCGELFLGDSPEDEKKLETEKATEVAHVAAEKSPVEILDNAVLRKLLRGPRYFDPPDSSWGTCYNCGEDGHRAVNCTSAKRKKPCFICGSLEHNAKQCSKGHDCFICKQHGHRAKDCPEKSRIDSKSSKLCLKCGDSGHDMFSCKNDYSPDDLKEMECYICHKFGHLCCVNYNDSPRELSCYRCGLLGHTGLACSGSRRDATASGSASSCYRCGEAGHFARECTNSVKAVKRNREPSTPRKKSSKKNRDRAEAKSVPPDLDKAYRRKTQYEGGYASASKSKHRGGWITVDPGEYHSNPFKENYWRSPATPSIKKAKLSSSTVDGGSSSCSSRKPHKRHYSNSNSASNGSAKSYHHLVYSASRFGYSSNDGRRDYRW